MALTESDLQRIAQIVDDRLEKRLMPIANDLKDVRIKTNQMWDALEKHGLPLVRA